MKRLVAAGMFGLVMSCLCTASGQREWEFLGAPPYGPTHVGSVDMSERPASRPPYLPREPQVITKGALAPSADDRTAYATFLSDRNSGLIRLLPHEQTQSNSKDEKNRTIGTSGAYFSFANRTHALQFGADIAFDHNKLSVGFGLFDYGMLTNLGDTPLGALTLSDKEVKSIAAFRPPRSPAAAEADYLRIKSNEGMIFDGRAYRNQLPVQENSTYLLRSVVYRRSDVLVAFRVVRKDADGSLIIVWKLLKQYPTPELERARFAMSSN